MCQGAFQLHPIMQHNSEILEVNDDGKLQAHKVNLCSITGNVSFRTNTDTMKWVISNHGDTSQLTLYFSAKEHFGCIKSSRKKNSFKAVIGVW